MKQRLLYNLLITCCSWFLFSCHESESAQAIPTTQMGHVESLYKAELKNIVDSLQVELGADSIIQYFEFVSYNKNSLYSYDYHLCVLSDKFSQVQPLRTQEILGSVKDRVKDVILGVRHVDDIVVSLHGYDKQIAKSAYSRYDSFQNIMQ